MMGTLVFNPPHSPFLGMRVIKNRQLCIGGKIETILFKCFALTHGHRIIDGGETVLYLREIKECGGEGMIILFGI